MTFAPPDSTGAPNPFSSHVCASESATRDSDDLSAAAAGKPPAAAVLVYMGLLAFEILETFGRSTFGVLEAAAVTWSDDIAPGHTPDARRWPSAADYLVVLP